MHCLKSAILFAAATLGAASSAFAGAGIVNTTVTELAPNVSYSTGGTNPLVTYIGYLVTVGSDASNTNTINNIEFTGSASATDPAEKPTFISADGATCTTTNADQTAISCTIGQLRAGQTFPPFAVFFKAPVKEVNGVADNATEDAAKFSGITYYAETTGGLQSPPQNSTAPWSAPDVLLGTPSPVSVKSGVQKTGGTLFTGSGAAETPADPWTTTVVVPGGFVVQGGATYTTAEIYETENLPTCAADLLTCNISELTIPGTFAKLIVTLRRDVLTIAKSAKIGSARIYYANPTSPDSRINYSNFEVPPCTDSSTYGPLPQVGIPCLNKRTAYTKKTAPTPAWEGDWEFEIFALDNGRYIN